MESGPRHAAGEAEVSGKPALSVKVTPAVGKDFTPEWRKVMSDFPTGIGRSDRAEEVLADKARGEGSAGVKHATASHCRQKTSGFPSGWGSCSRVQPSAPARQAGNEGSDPIIAVQSSARR